MSLLSSNGERTDHLRFKCSFLIKSWKWDAVLLTLPFSLIKAKCLLAFSCSLPVQRREMHLIMGSPPEVFACSLNVLDIKGAEQCSHLNTELSVFLVCFVYSILGCSE